MSPKLCGGGGGGEDDDREPAEDANSSADAL